jgi:starch phosphorylase
MGGSLETAATTELELASRDGDGSYIYTGQLAPAGGGRVGYTVRVLPNHHDLPNPLATGLVRWA